MKSFFGCKFIVSTIETNSMLFFLFSFPLSHFYFVNNLGDIVNFVLKCTFVKIYYGMRPKKDFHQNVSKEVCHSRMDKSWNTQTHIHFKSNILSFCLTYNCLYTLESLLSTDNGTQQIQQVTIGRQRRWDENLHNNCSFWNFHSF